jgi:hypothetical protein
MRIRFDMPVPVDVIRLAFWEVAFMVAIRVLFLVVLFPAQSWIGILWFKFFEELHQPVDQSSPASDDMETALVLMLFQDFVQSTFQFFHRAPPQLGNLFRKPRVIAAKASEASNNTVAIPSCKMET